MALAVIVVVMVVFVLVVMAMAFLTVFVVMVVFVLTLCFAFGAVAFFAVVVVMVVGLIDIAVDTAVLQEMHHVVLEFMGVHIEDRSHEVVFCRFAGVECSVVFDTVVQVGKVQCDSFSVFLVDGHLYVTEETACLMLDVLSGPDHDLVEPGLDICIETFDDSGETCGCTACLCDRSGFAVAFCFAFGAVAFAVIVVVMVVFVTVTLALFGGVFFLLIFSKHIQTFIFS
jgi:hypothetical protein